MISDNDQTSQSLFVHKCLLFDPPEAGSISDVCQQPNPPCLMLDASLPACLLACLLDDFLGFFFAVFDDDLMFACFLPACLSVYLLEMLAALHVLCARKQEKEKHGMEERSFLFLNTLSLSANILSLLLHMTF